MPMVNNLMVNISANIGKFPAIKQWKHAYGCFSVVTTIAPHVHDKPQDLGISVTADKASEISL